MREYSVSEELKAKLKKLLAKDPESYSAVSAKMREIIAFSNVEHYKNLRAPYNQFKRVHVMKSFVLIFSYDKARDAVLFHRLDHHDDVYR